MLNVCDINKLKDSLFNFFIKKNKLKKKKKKT